MNVEFQKEWQYGSRHPEGLNLAKATASARSGAALHYFTIMAHANELVQKGNDGILRGLAKFDREADNIRAVWKWAAELNLTMEYATNLCRYFTTAIAQIAEIRLPPREWLSWLEASVTACRFFKDRDDEGTNLGRMGNAYLALGNFRQAVHHHEQHLAIAREIQIASQRALPSNLASAYNSLGDAHKAIELHLESLSIRDRRHSRRSSHPWEPRIDLFDLGDAHKAIEFQQQSLAIARDGRHPRGGRAPLRTWRMPAITRRVSRGHQPPPGAFSDRPEDQGSQARGGRPRRPGVGLLQSGFSPSRRSPSAATRIRERHRGS